MFTYRMGEEATEAADLLHETVTKAAAPRG
jgi:hypothetical protein